jgi:hypothetical protein
MPAALAPRRALLALLLAALTLALGCSKGGPAPEDSDPRQLRLKQIFQMSKMSKKGNQPPAKTLEDFRQAEQIFPRGFRALKTGECVFDWAAYANPSAASTAVLAYEKDVPGKGGYVVLLNGTVKNMTADEFKAAQSPR